MSTKTNDELIEEARQFMYSNLVVGKGDYNRQIINSLIEALQQAEHPGKPTAPKIPNFEVKRITLDPGLDPLWGIVDNHLSRFAPFYGEEDARNTRRNFEDHTSNPERYEWYALPVERTEPPEAPGVPETPESDARDDQGAGATVCRHCGLTIMRVTGGWIHADADNHSCWAANEGIKAIPGGLIAEPTP